MEVLSGMLVVAFAVFLIGLAVLIATKPERAERFLRSFASSPRAHYAEQALRLIAGGGMVIFAPSMWYSDLFELFGWLIIVTAVALLLLPWRWHYEFGRWAIPLVIRRMKLFALGAFALGTLIFYGVSVSCSLEDSSPVFLTDDVTGSLVSDIANSSTGGLEVLMRDRAGGLKGLLRVSRPDILSARAPAGGGGGQTLRDI